MDKILTSNLKRVFIFSILIFCLLSTYLIFSLKLNFIYKISLLLIIFIFFLSFLTISELVNPPTTNITFWLLVSLIFSYFYLWSGVIIFILTLLRLVSKENLINSSVKIPFYSLIYRDYHFFVLAFVLITSLFSFQKLINTQSLPLAYEDYQKIYNFLKQKFNFSIEQYTQNLLEQLFKKQNIPIDKKMIYDFLSQGWQNQKIKLVLILTFIFFLFSFVYHFLILISPLLVISALLLIYFYKALGLFKINYQDIKKEVFEI